MKVGDFLVHVDDDAPYASHWRWLPHKGEWMEIKEVHEEGVVVTCQAFDCFFAFIPIEEAEKLGLRRA